VQHTTYVNNTSSLQAAAQANCRCSGMRTPSSKC